MTVTPEMIERVAKAICASEGFEPDEECLPGTPHFVAYFPQAQAAYEAMSQASPPPLDDEVGWQPIETAPDNEDGILICDASKPNPAVGVARFMEGKWKGAHLEWGFVSEAIWPQPTHWKPLPTPPAHDD